MRGPIKALYGSEANYRKARGPGDLMGRIKDLEQELGAIQARRRSEVLVDEFAYPPWVQEALDLVERETARIEREERQANCPHENTYVVDDSSVEEPGARIRICPDCSATEYFDVTHET